MLCFIFFWFYTDFKEAGSEIKQKTDLKKPGSEIKQKTDIHAQKKIKQDPGLKTENTINCGTLVKPDKVTSQTASLVVKPPADIQAQKNIKQDPGLKTENNINMPPAARMTMKTKINPLASLNPYQSYWTIKVHVNSKTQFRNYKNKKGEGFLFSVVLNDEDGTEIQATMFNEVANKLYDKFQVGKVYYISKGSLGPANRRYSVVQNDYEMILNEKSEVEEAINETMLLTKPIFNFVSIDQLGEHVNKIVDVIGVVKTVATPIKIKRKLSEELTPKRDITIADDTNTTVLVSLWNDHAIVLGEQLFRMADKFPIVAIKSVKVGKFRGVSLSAIPQSTIEINPDMPEYQKLRSWLDSKGKNTNLDSISTPLIPSAKKIAQSMYSDRVTLDHITSNPSLGDDKPVFFSTQACMTFIKHDQTMSYRACKICLKKVSPSIESGYWCASCQKKEEECSLRYILSVKFTDVTGEAWFSLFNDEAEKLLGCSANELHELKSKEDGLDFQLQLKRATWVPHVLRVSVAPTEYKDEKRQKITVKAIKPVDFAAESKYLLDEINSMKASSGCKTGQSTSEISSD